MDQALRHLVQIGLLLETPRAASRPWRPSSWGCQTEAASRPAPGRTWCCSTVICRCDELLLKEMRLTLMFEEAISAPDAIDHLLSQDRARYEALGNAWRAEPRAACSRSRGSSDHAAHYFAYLAMARLGRLVTSLPMSLLTLYQSQLDTRGLTSIAFSQSGRSPDLILPTQQLREQQRAHRRRRQRGRLAAGQKPPSMCCRCMPAPSAAWPRQRAISRSWWPARASSRPGRPSRALRLALRACPRRCARRAGSTGARRFRCCRTLTACSSSAGPRPRRRDGSGPQVQGRPAASRPGLLGRRGQAQAHGLGRERLPLLVFAPRGPAQAGLLQLADGCAARAPACCWPPGGHARRRAAPRAHRA